MNSLRNNWTTSVLVLLFLATSSAALSAAKRIKPGGEQESELMSAVRKEKETDYAKKLDLLDQWKEEYPETTHEEERTRDYMLAYFGAGNWLKAFDAAQELIKIRPKDSAAHFAVVLITLFVEADNSRVQDAGQSSANLILSDGVEKPEQFGEAQWQQFKKTHQKAAHKALGWIAMHRGDNQAAERHFAAVLQMDPNSAQVSLWLGKTLLAEGNSAMYGWALFCLARAAAYEGDGGLSPDIRKQTDTLLTQTYTKYFWTDKGLDKLKESAKLQPFPPATIWLAPKYFAREMLKGLATFSLFFFVPAVVLFIASIVAQEADMSETTISFLFGLSGFCLWMGFSTIGEVVDLIVRGNHTALFLDPPGDFLHFVRVFGNWSSLNIVGAFSGAISAFIMGQLAKLTDAVKSDSYEGIAAISAVIGVVYVIGVSLFLGTTAQLLGIVATVIGILVGFKTLMGKKAE